jgi:hypothetical protein
VGNCLPYSQAGGRQGLVWWDEQEAKRALLLISTEGGTVIDDIAKATALAAKMEICLPIPVRPTSAFVRLMRQHGIRIDRDRELSVRRVFYTKFACHSQAPTFL